MTSIFYVKNTLFSGHFKISLAAFFCFPMYITPWNKQKHGKISFWDIQYTYAEKEVWSNSYQLKYSQLFFFSAGISSIRDLITSPNRFEVIKSEPILKQKMFIHPTYLLVLKTIVILFLPQWQTLNIIYLCIIVTIFFLNLVDVFF